MILIFLLVCCEDVEDVVPAVSIAGSCLRQRGIHKVQEQKQSLFREIEGVAARTPQCMWAAREGDCLHPDVAGAWVGWRLVL